MRSKNLAYGKASIYPAVVAGLLGLLLCTGDVLAAEKKGASVKPKSSPPKAVATAPVCSPDLHPSIKSIAPDRVRAGMKIAIKGSNFGKKECFKDVSFGSTSSKEFKVVNDSLVEVTVPAKLKSGMMMVHVQTAGGTADNTILVESK